jgi:hypothetical protein
LPKRWQQCIDCEEDWRGQEPLVNKLNLVFFTDSVSELYGKRYIRTCLLDLSGRDAQWALVAPST